MMRWLCALGWHRWYVYPQATELRILQRGGVEAFCDRCRASAILYP